jgi:hypothetical protein
MALFHKQLFEDSGSTKTINTMILQNNLRPTNKVEQFFTMAQMVCPMALLQNSALNTFVANGYQENDSPLQINEQ